MNKNITKKLNLTLEDIGEFLAKLSEKSNTVYWLSSPDLKKIQHISPAYEKIWGRSRKLLYTNPEIWLSYLHPDDVKNFPYHPIHKMAERIIQLGPEARYEENYRIIKPNGEIRYITDRGFPIYGNDGVCYAVTGVAIDITQEKQIEEKLRLAKEAAEVASHAKTEFLENMRHDIRTPLTGILGCAQIIQSQTMDRQIAEFAEDLVQSSEALLEFLNRILENIKVSSGKVLLLKKKFNPYQEIESIIKLNKSLARKKNLAFTFSYDEKIPRYLLGDSIRLQRILLELTTNALTFTQTGEVKLVVELEKRLSRQVIIKIMVIDTGMGIPVNKQQDIYMRFTRLIPSYKGTYPGAGLGLALVKQFLDDLEGEIYLESQPKKGSTFICFIPFQEPLSPDSCGVEEAAHVLE
jgi:PAS domain S-box-containing protein